MGKKFSVVIRETREQVIKVLNESGLPIDAIDMMLGELKTVVHAQAESEYAAEIQAGMQKEESECSEE